MARVFIGTYTRGESKGVYVAEFDPTDGALALTGETGEARNPTFLALHPSGRTLYAANETADFDGQPGGGVSAYAIDPASGALSLLGSQLARGSAPCHLITDPSGRCVLLANYSSGSVAVLPILEDGRLGAASCVIQHQGRGPDPSRQQGPHAHSINLDPTGRYALACDLGLDQVLVYRFDPAAATLSPHDPPYASTHPAAGPRHLAFSPNGRFCYVINELDNTLISYAWNADAGTLTKVETQSTLPADWTGTSYCADVHVHPNGRFVYGSNRGHHSLAVFATDPETGALSPIEIVSCGGDWPRNFAIDPSGQWLLAANERSDDIVTFAIDTATGRLTPAGPVCRVPAPVCVLFA